MQARSCSAAVNLIADDVAGSHVPPRPRDVIVLHHRDSMSCRSGRVPEWQPIPPTHCKQAIRAAQHGLIELRDVEPETA